MSEGVLVIRAADPKEDMDRVRALFRQYVTELGEDLGFQGFEEELQTLPGEYSWPAGSLYLAWADEQPAGCIAMRRLDENTCEMKRLYVRPEYRGRKLGGHLVRTIIASARAHNYKVMKLDSLRRLKSAYTLYKSFGFRETEPYTYNPLPEAVYMELRL